ncbi:hypothetical protein ABZZ17_36895 [Streptomyces sp. NPDC006512]|uniref:hypothetical protein n=1 Tax=Streptomyces sp. NPDC006512 TaxID=3154307 RepID=UPI0033BC128C
MRAAARSDLSAAWDRVVELARRCGRDPDEVLAVERLGHLSGVEPALIPQVVAGTAAEVPLERRVHQRFLRLRATRRDKHGREWSLAAIAEDFDAPGASLGPLNAGTGLPRLGHAAGVQRFFGVYAGFLLADSKSAVERALATAGPDGPAAADDLDHLSYLSGLTPQAIRLTLDGNPPRLPLREQVRLRFEHLRRTRPRADGQPHSLTAIAGSFDASGQSLTRLAQGEGLPNLAAAAGIQRFYGVEGGFLLDGDAQALAGVLGGIERELRAAGADGSDGANPMLAVLRAHDVRSIVTRAGRLSPAGWKSLADYLDDLLAREGQPVPRRADAPGTEAGPRPGTGPVPGAGSDAGSGAGAGGAEGAAGADRDGEGDGA